MSQSTFSPVSHSMGYSTRGRFLPTFSRVDHSGVVVVVVAVVVELLSLTSLAMVDAYMSFPKR